MKNILSFIFLGVFFLLFSCKTTQPKHDYYLRSHEISSFYGFIVTTDEIARSFYMVDKKIMLKYINRIKVDSIEIVNDLREAKWVAEATRGVSYNSYVWYDFVDSIKQNNFYLDIGDDFARYYSIIPVYITTFDRINIKYPKYDQSPFFKNRFRVRGRFNICYVQPLERKMWEELMLFEDNFNRQVYFDYLKRKKLM